MAKDRRRIVITRVMQLATVLHQTRRGLTLKELVEKLECGRSTVYRDLDSLKHAGIALRTETVVGEVRYSLSHWPIAAIAPTPLQLAALHFAREALDGFSGTEAIKQLDQLLSQWSKLPKNALALKYQKRGAQSGSFVSTLDRAIAERKQVEILYQGDNDRIAKPRRIEPIELRSSNMQIYLFAYDVDRQDYRVFKLSRLSKVQLLKDDAADHSHVDVDARFRRAVNVWHATTPSQVVVRLSAGKARFADEYPLVRDQEVITLPDGSLEITATVNGMTEALNWVLSWGAHAEAMSPPEFRAMAAQQLRDAAQKYTESAAHAPQRRTRGGRALAVASRIPRGTVVQRPVSPELGRGRVRVGG